VRIALAAPFLMGVQAERAEPVVTPL
jgi:hypothetical protein